jgi:hypothetical protein
MELQFFNRQNTYATGKNGSPTVLFSEKGSVRLSAVAVAKMNLKAEDSIEFAFDAKGYTWYMVLCPKERGYVLRAGGKDDKALHFNASAISKKVTEGFEANTQNSVSALVGGSVELDGRTFWPLLMKRKVGRP